MAGLEVFADGARPAGMEVFADDPLGMATADLEARRRETVEGAGEGMPPWLAAYLRESATSLGEGASEVGAGLWDILKSLGGLPLPVQMSGDPDYAVWRSEPLGEAGRDLLRGILEAPMVVGAPLMPVVGGVRQGALVAGDAVEEVVRMAKAPAKMSPSETLAREAAALKGALLRDARKEGNKALEAAINGDYRRSSTMSFLEKYRPEKYTVPYEGIPKFPGEELGVGGYDLPSLGVSGAQSPGGRGLVARVPPAGEASVGVPGDSLREWQARRGSGSELTDPDGRPLFARYIVGRGPDGLDRALSPAATRDAAESLTDAFSLAPGQAVGGDYGVTRWRPPSPGSPEVPNGILRMFIRDNLPPDIQHATIQHEIGHAIDDVTRRLSYDIGRDPALAAVAEEISKRARGPNWKVALTNDAAKRYLSGAEELAADAFRAYQVNPTWFRDTYPDMAARIRGIANDAPRSAGVIQFNSLFPWATLGGAAGLGALAASGPDDPNL